MLKPGGNVSRNFCLRKLAKWIPTIKTSRPEQVNKTGVPADVSSDPHKATPDDWPKKKHEANAATAAPRRSGAICVALICSVLCIM